MDGGGESILILNCNYDVTDMHASLIVCVIICSRISLVASILCQACHHDQNSTALVTSQLPSRCKHTSFLKAFLPAPLLSADARPDIESFIYSKLYVNEQ